MSQHIKVGNEKPVKITSSTYSSRNETRHDGNECSNTSSSFQRTPTQLHASIYIDKKK